MTTERPGKHQNACCDRTFVILLLWEARTNFFGLEMVKTIASCQRKYCTVYAVWSNVCEQMILFSGDGMCLLVYICLACYHK